MSISPFSQVSPQSVQTTVVVEPIYTVLSALSLLNSSMLDAEQEPWLYELASKMTPAQRETNRIVLEWFGCALIPTVNHISFLNLVTAIEAESPTALRDRILKTWLSSANDEEATPRSMLADEKRFFAFAASLSEEQAGDHAVVSTVYDLLKDPPALQTKISSHLRAMWEAEFADEWRKKVPMMRYCTDELNARAWPSESPIKVLQGFIRSEVPDYIMLQLTGIKQIRVAPSPFIKLHASRLGSPDTLWLFMLVDFWQLPMRTEPIKRGEVKGTASALADETRLQILELLAANEELRAQEIIARLDTSQSTVSRHLKQLSNNQLITEKRAGDANKIYRLNPSRVSEFAHTLSALLSKENAQIILNDVRLDLPTELQPYLDRNGLVTQWPAKWKNQQAVLDYLIEKFTLEQKYTEKQVNQILLEWHTYDDPAYLRRALIETRQLLRTPNGAEYWRAASES